jgi:hypothetical protein
VTVLPGVYSAQFERSFLAQVPLGAVDIEVSGLLADATPFQGTATVQTWKPVILTDVHTENAKGQVATQFGRNKAMIVRYSYLVDPRAGERPKVSLLVKAFGRSFRSNWLPVSPGAGQLGYMMPVPAGAPLGTQDLQVILRLKKGERIIDKATQTLSIEVLE